MFAPEHNKHLFVIQILIFNSFRNEDYNVEESYNDKAVFNQLEDEEEEYRDIDKERKKPMKLLMNLNEWNPGRHSFLFQQSTF
jgi:hypothetical protein